MTERSGAGLAAGIVALAAACVLPNPAFDGASSAATLGGSASGGEASSGSSSVASATGETGTGGEATTAGATSEATVTGGEASVTSDSASASEGTTAATGTTGGAIACDFSPGAWVVEQPQLLDAVNEAKYQLSPSLLPDGDTLFFTRFFNTSDDSFRAVRAGFGEPFGAPLSNTDPFALNSPGDDGRAVLTEDLLEVVIARDSQLTGNVELHRGARASADEPFTGIKVMQDIAPFMGDDRDPFLTTDGLTLYFSRLVSGPANHDIMVTTRPQLGVDFGAPTAVTATQTTNGERSPTISDDDMVLLFARFSGGVNHIFYVQRPAPGEPFGAATKLAGVSLDTANDMDPFLAQTGDHCELFFVSDRPTAGGDPRIYRAAIASP